MFFPLITSIYLDCFHWFMNFVICLHNHLLNVNKSYNSKLKLTKTTFSVENQALELSVVLLRNIVHVYTGFDLNMQNPQNKQVLLAFSVVYPPRRFSSKSHQQERFQQAQQHRRSLEAKNRWLHARCRSCCRGVEELVTCAREILRRCVEYDVDNDYYQEVLREQEALLLPGGLPPALAQTEERRGCSSQKERGRSQADKVHRW